MTPEKGQSQKVNKSVNKEDAPKVEMLKLTPVQKDHVRRNILDALQDNTINGVPLWDKMMGGTMKSLAIEAVAFHYSLPEVSAVDKGEKWEFKFKFMVPGTEHEILVSREIGKGSLENAT